MEFAVSMLTSPGGRPENQDACDYALVDGMGCFVLADGLGGHRGGEVAALTALDGFLDAFEDAPAITNEAVGGYMLAAHQAVLDRRSEDSRLVRMRTTLVGVAVGEGHAVWAHVGDSRLYHFRNGRIIFQTKDHSVPQAMVSAGEITFDQIRGHEDRNRLVRALGKGENFKPRVLPEPVPVRPGDVFLLCTDGLWEHVLEREMEESLVRSLSEADGEARAMDGWVWAMEGMVLSRAEGEFDNYSAVAVSVVE